MLVRLNRTVRFAVNPPGTDAPTDDPNGFGGKPSMRGLGRHYELTVACLGETHPDTGYLVNIKDIDRAARTTVIPAIVDACHTAPATEPMTMLPDLLPALDGALGGIVKGLTWHLTPTYSVHSEKETLRVIILRQSFDFAASHRLHVAALSDEENRAVFGKCNNPSGHGHNYRVEPTVAVDLDKAWASGGAPFGLAQLERLVESHVIERFDHTYLNTDTQDFGDAGVNPSVEHIAKRCYELLASEIDAASSGTAELRSVTVWETDRTSATYEPAAVRAGNH